MVEINVNIRDLFAKPIAVRTGDPTTIVVARFPGTAVEMEDAHFHFDSAVMLPVAPAQDGSDLAPPEQVSGLAVLAVCLEHAAENPNDQLLVAGHTDTSGEATGNFELSQLRADSVLHALTGNRGEWARIADQRHRVLDIQLVLKWASRELDWPCDPVELDDDEGPHTKKAIEAFQAAYNEEYQPPLEVDGKFGPKTWAAVFDVYMFVLADLLSIDEDRLASRQAALTFLPERRTVGCGETHPLEASGRDGFRSATNRRVELLFFQPGNEPQLVCHPGEKTCKPELCEIYTKKLFDLELIPVKPFPTGTLNITLLDDRHATMPDAPFRLRIGDVEKNGTADGNALVSVADVPLPPTCELAWGALSTDPDVKNQDPNFRFLRTLHIRVRPKSPRHRNQQAHRRLQNLGYLSDIRNMVSAFQSDFQKPGDVWFDQPTYDEVLTTHDTGQPAPPDPNDDGSQPAEIARAERQSDSSTAVA